MKKHIHTSTYFRPVAATFCITGIGNPLESAPVFVTPSATDKADLAPDMIQGATASINRAIAVVHSSPAFIRRAGAYDSQEHASMHVSPAPVH